MSGRLNPLDVEDFLPSEDYPMSKEQLLRTAERRGANDDMLRALRRIPDRTYDGPSAVCAQVAQQT